MKGKLVSNVVCCLVLFFVFVIGVIPARAAPLTIDAGNEDYFVTTNETVDEIRVGNINDDNRLIVQSDATLTTTANHRLYLGYGATSSGNLVQVTGAGSTINSTGDWTFVGLRGVENTLRIENGGTINSYGGHVGYYPDSIGNDAQVEGSGSRWNLLSEHLYIGRDGDSNSATISAGGTVAIEGDGKGLRIGVEAAADNNRVTITGSGSLLDANDAVYVGQSGTNSSLTVADSGSLDNVYGFLGYFSGSSGTGTVTGADSQWNNAHSLYIGGHSSAAGGSGTLNLNDSGLVTVAGTTTLWSTGTINLDGGNLTTGSFDNSDGGSLNFNDGTLTVNGAGGVFNPGTVDFTIDGNAATDFPELVIAGEASATVVGSFDVGDIHQGSLVVAAGGVVTSRNWGYIGDQIGSMGVATVTGTNSQWTNWGSLLVGRNGEGILNVEAGGDVSSGAGTIGHDSRSTGVATVTGTNSQWTNTGSLTVGLDGEGTLNVEAGGEVISAGGFITVDGKSTGVVTVTGTNSKWTNSGNLYVGHGGDEDGKLVVAAGGVVSNTDGFIGYQGDGDGKATVTGTGSKWTNTGELYVGKYGDGTLNIESAGAVISAGGYIAHDGNSPDGVVTISGSDSTWTNSGDLHVGKSGSGTLNITDSGEVHVGGMTWLYANARVNIDGGAMSVGETLQLDAGSVVNLNSGTLSLIGFSGDGNLAWNGGTLEITPPTGLTVGAGGLLGTLLTIDAAQTLNVTNTTTIQSGARIIAVGGFASDLLKIESGGQFDAPSGFTNQDEIQLSGVDARITGGLLTNNGFISGQGRINAPLTNTGQVEVSNGTLRFGSQVTNNGQVNVFGGTLRFGSQVTNNAGGFIGGRDVFSRFGGGLTNNAEIGLSAGVHDILGSIDNTINGRVMVAGQSTATFYGDMTNDGDIFTGQGSHSVFLGDVTGDGTFPGTGIVEFAGEISPGNSPGTVSFGGDVVLGSGSTTVIELGGTVRDSEYDALLVDGDLTLAGSLDVLAIGGFVPQAGDFFDILDFEPANLNGVFDNMNLPSLTPGLAWDQTNLYTTGTLLVSLAPSPLSGDFNYDGTVDAADFTVWQDNLGLDASVLNGNGSGAATVVQADYLLWKTNFGDSLASGSQGEPVPEPATLLLAVLALVAVPRRMLAACQTWDCRRKCPTSR